MTSAGRSRPARRPGAFFVALFGAALAVASAAGCGPEAGEASRSSDTTSADARTMMRPTQGVDVLDGTAGADVIKAGGGNDVVRGAGGDDELSGGEGIDELDGGPGDDLVDAQDPRSVGEVGRDEISCGPGRDEVLMDADDGEKPRDCEEAGVGAS